MMRRSVPRVPRLAGAAVTALLLLAPATAQAGWPGADFSTGNVRTNWGPLAALVKVHCPPGTTYSGRPGDYSFCTGSISIYYKGKLAGAVPVTLRTNDRLTQQVPLQRWFELLVRHKRHVKGVTFKITSHDGQGNFASHTLVGSLTDTFRNETG